MVWLTKFIKTRGAGPSKTHPFISLAVLVYFKIRRKHNVQLEVILPYACYIWMFASNFGVGIS